MLNRNLVESMVQVYAANNTINMEMFADLFTDLTENELTELFGILEEMNVSITDDEADDAALPESIAFDPMSGVFEIRRLTKLSNEELCVMFQRGNRVALDALAIKNKRLVYKIACHCFNDYRPECLDIEELYDEGNIGLAKAAQKFEVRKGFKFTTYATWWIRQSVVREIQNAGFQLRLPVHVYDSLYLIRKCKNAYRPKSIEELQTLLAMDGHVFTIKKLETLMIIGEKYTHVGSLNELVGEEKDSERIDCDAG